jgi:dienelactone hydrolase
MKKLSLFGFACLLVACTPKKNEASRHLKTSSVVYQQDGKDFEGYIAAPKSANGKLPAILIIHEWDGLGDYIKSRANMLAENGYFAFAMDMYGKGIRAKDHKEAAELSGAYGKDRKLLRSRVETGLAVLKAREEVDPNRIVVIGYCFGGMAAIETALMGADIKGVVTFHAALSFPTIAQDAANVKVPILINHGGADAFIPATDIKALKSAFDKAKVSYKFVVHEGATHGFTNKGHGDSGEHMGMKYNPKGDLASWASLLAFLRQNLN